MILITTFESGDKISLHDANGREFYFKISRLIDSGASVRCYKAERRDKSGILRQVKLKGAAAENYLRSYTLLRDAMLESDSIKSFIPSIEIFYDADDQPYVWSDEPELVTFEKLCAGFQQNPQPDAAYNLVLALSAIKYLTQCVCELHTLGLVHRDIKPSNFGFVKRGDEILTQTVSLFDVDSICSVFVEPRIRVFTPGFSELGSRADNLSDIYSIGATLFAALIGKLYNDLDFDDIKNLVDDCPLVTNVVGLHFKLKALIVKILRDCLDDRERRYQSCEELLIDVNAALDYAVPSELQTRMNSDEQLMWTDVRQFLETHKRKDFAACLQHHLYATPLYRWRARESGNLNVLILGCGDYAQGFLDGCLTLGQMPKVALNVTIIGDDRADFDLYLESRPALRDFFSIDGEAIQNNYGHIRFERRALTDEIATNEEIVQDILCDRDEDQLPHYIFIALGNNNLNYIAARACQKTSEALNFSCGVNYVWEGGACPTVEEALIPLNPDDDFKRTELHREIERMAFNAHLIWEKSLLIDRKKLRTEFRQPYNHKSCVSNVISLKYKLHGIGIDADRLSTDECAAALDKIISEGARRIIDELIYFEHRRWVAEKICDGWVKRAISDCRTGVTKDQRKKNHVCIVRSRPDQMLSREFDRAKWDKCSDAQLERLDELDRMSVALHRMFVREANAAKKNNLLNGEQASNLKNLIGDDAEVLTALNDWLSCAEDIWNERSAAVRMYRSLRDRLSDALKNLPKGAQNKAEQYVRFIDEQFAPIRLGMEYRNYKDDDKLLIHEAPFILTYTENICLVVPFNYGTNTKMFGNIAAAAVVNARTIIYVLHLSSVGTAEWLKANLSSDLEGLFDYADRKNLRADFEFICLYDQNAVDDERCGEVNDVLENFDQLKGKIRWFATDDEEAIAPTLEKYLRTRIRPGRLLALEKNSSQLSSILKGGGLYKKFDCYEFDMPTQKFSTGGRCKILSYIHKPAHLTIDDLFLFKRSNIVRRNKPEFFGDYKTLWDLYRRSPRDWKKLCEWLATYESDYEQSTLAALDRPRSAHDNLSVTFNYIVPIECRATIEKIIDALKDIGLAAAESKIVVSTTTACEVFIKTGAVDERAVDRMNAEFDRLFSNPYVLTNPNVISVRSRANQIIVQLDDLIVRKLQNTVNSEVIQLLRDLRDIGYITDLWIDADKVSFTYPTLPIKHLLIQSGKILEIYVYHKLLASGLFDDISCGCVITWQDTDATNEFDCLLTKGFNSYFIECKARSALLQDFYYKLNSLVQQFGINAKAIMIADTLERQGDVLSNANEIQSRRGELQNVLTIRQAREIDAIDETIFSTLPR